jgi:hypothetical protein
MSVIKLNTLLSVNSFGTEAIRRSTRRLAIHGFSRGELRSWLAAYRDRRFQKVKNIDLDEHIDLVDQRLVRIAVERLPASSALKVKCGRRGQLDQIASATDSVTRK